VYDFVAGETREGVATRFDSAVKAACSSSDVDEVEHEAVWDEDEDAAEEEEEEDLSSLERGGSRTERGMSISMEVGGEEKGV
jgi:hypothetical protein